MKKLIGLFVLLTTISCSNEDQVESNSAPVSNLSSSVLDGKMLSFKNEESFIKEYSEVSEMKSSKEVQNWISKKGLESLLNNSDDSNEMEEDVISDTRIIYSDALKAILNYDSKVKIGGEVVWLDERKFYLLPKVDIDKNANELKLIKDELGIYGQLLGSFGFDNNLTSRDVFPNENRSKTFVTELDGEEGSRLRHVLDLFNETIVINNLISSSKMYLRSALQYRSCSTWRCTWKTASDLRTLSTYDLFCSVCQNDGIFKPWKMEPQFNVGSITGTQTFLLANWQMSNIQLDPYPNFEISGSVTGGAKGGVFTTNLSWY